MNREHPFARHSETQIRAVVDADVTVQETRWNGYFRRLADATRILHGKEGLEHR